MIITKMALPRRTFLRGMGATLALPLLDAMVPAMTRRACPVGARCGASGSSTSRWGRSMTQWMPKTEGRLTELSPTLAPLTPLLDQLTVVSNLEMKNAYAAAQPRDGEQHVPERRAARSRPKGPTTSWRRRSIRSPRSSSARTRRCRRSSSRPTSTTSWATATTATLRLHEHAGVVDADDAAADRSEPARGVRAAVRRRRHGRRAAERSCGRAGSILDWVTGDMARLQRRLGASDRARVGDYLDSMREIERRIQKAEQQDATRDARS